MDMSKFLIIYIVVLGFGWWFFGRKQREKNKAMQAQMNNLKAGDHIVTIGGLHGIVSHIDTTANTVEIDCDGIFLTFERRAIHHVVPTVGDAGLVTTADTVVGIEEDTDTPAETEE